MIEFPCNQSMLCVKVENPEVLDLKEISRFDLEHCYQAHMFCESWNHKASNFSLSNIGVE